MATAAAGGGGRAASGEGAGGGGRGGQPLRRRTFLIFRVPQRRPLGADVPDSRSDDGRCLTWKVSVRALGRARRLLLRRHRPSPHRAPAGTCLQGGTEDGRLPPVTQSPSLRGRLGFPAPPRVPARTRLPAPLPPGRRTTFTLHLLFPVITLPGSPLHIAHDPSPRWPFRSKAPSPKLEPHAESPWMSALRLPSSCPPGTPPRAPNTPRHPPSQAFGAVGPSLPPQILHPGPLPFLPRPCCRAVSRLAPEPSAPAGPAHRLCPVRPSLLAA